MHEGSKIPLVGFYFVVIEEFVGPGESRRIRTLRRLKRIMPRSGEEVNNLLRLIITRPFLLAANWHRTTGY